MKNLTKTLLAIYIAIMCVAVACKKDEPTPTPITPPVVTTKSSAKDIAKFSFAALSPAVDATIDASTKSITATVPAGTDVTKLVPTITISDKATVSPATGVAQDFSKEVSYTVTAEDGSTAVWKVGLKKVVEYAQNDMLFYGGDDKKVYALDAEAGTKKWEFLTTGKIESAPAYSNGVLYVGTSFESNANSQTFAKLYALDAKTGTKKWEYQVDYYFNNRESIRTSPLISDGMVYFGSVNGQWQGDNNFYALDINTGKLIWKYTLKGNTESSIYSSPTIADGLVYFGSYNKFLYALDAKSGTEKWKYDTGYGYLPCSPVVTNGVVYIGNRSFMAFDAKTGTKKWDYKGIYGNTEDDFTEDPITSDNLIFTVDDSNLFDKSKLFALNMADGTKKWEYDFTTHVSGLSTEGDLLFVTTRMSTEKALKLWAFDNKTGIKKWDFNGFGGTGNTPTSANGIVYLTNQDKKVYAIYANTGLKKWEYPSSAVILESCVVVDKNGKAFHSSKSGMVQ